MGLGRWGDRVEKMPTRRCSMGGRILAGKVCDVSPHDGLQGTQAGRWAEGQRGEVNGRGRKETGERRKEEGGRETRRADLASARKLRLVLVLRWKMKVTHTWLKPSRSSSDAGLRAFDSSTSLEQRGQGPVGPDDRRAVLGPYWIARPTTEHCGPLWSRLASAYLPRAEGASRPCLSYVHNNPRQR